MIKLIILVILCITSFVSYSAEYKKVEKQYKGNVVKYYEDISPRIIDTTFSLKDNQDTEVLYVFSYNCSICYVFDDYVKEFEAFAKNNNIKFEKLPLYLDGEGIHKTSAETYFTRKFLNFNNDFDSIIFDLIHINNVSIKTNSDMRYLFIKYADVKEEIINSNEYNYKIKYRLERTQSILNNLSIKTTPTLIVHKSGKRFMIDATTAETPENLLFTLFAIMDLN